MKVIGIGCFFFLLLSEVSSQAQIQALVPQAITWERLEVKGSPRVIAISHYNVLNNEPVKDREQKLVFNKEGMVDSLLLADPVRDTVGMYIYRYNSSNHLDNIIHLRDWDFIDSVSFVRDRKGVVRSLLSYDKKRALYRKILVRYTTDGKLMYALLNDGDNRRLGMERYYYREDNEYDRLVLDEHQQFVSKYTFVEEKDSTGALQKLRYSYNAGDTCVELISQFFDSSGNEVEKSITDAGRRVLEYTKSSYKSGLLDRQTVYTEDRDQEFSYDFLIDQKGNWKQRKVFADGALTEIVSRGFIYEEQR